MTDGPGSSPDVPSGWAAEQPPPYGGAAGTGGTGGSWAAPGGREGPAGPQTGPYGQPGQHGQPGQPGSHGSYGQPGQYGQPGYGQSGPSGPSGQGPQAGGPHYGSGPYAQGPYAQGPYAQGSYAQGSYGQRPPEAPRPGIIPLRPLTLGDIFDGTIKLIRSNPKATLGLSAIVAAVTSIPGALGQAVGLGMFGTALEGFGSGSYATTGSPALPVVGVAAQYIGAIITYVMTFLGTMILTGILTRVLGRAVFGGRITVGEAWQLARSRVLALLGLAMLQALILVAPVLVLLALLVALGLGDATAGAFVAVALLFVLAYIPYAAFFYTRFSLAAPAVVLEGRGVTDAMARSWRLVKGDSWRVFGILVLTAVLAGIASSVLGVPFTIGGSLIGMFGGGTVAATALTTVLLAAGSVVASMITYPFQAGVAGLLYADRRMRAEAFDLVLQTAAAQNQSQGWVHTGVDDLWHPSHAAAAGPVPGPGSPPYDGTSPGGSSYYGTPPGASPYYGTPPNGPQG
ncbi:hypothetical protein F5972_01750 [Microbispora cellulosiformans]|uniref:DUF7847 domain-containing protein n=1 Tax=Microbispora cellulosiformans TaxID=2614688 RepID=A0A5J5KA84_9ACTN|nr:glycerophosphoryl diester phosphodiesterase membrane domain-containing protein [Microbispora cellulosiformans]KAA9381585.1 hypothetical protein F5972_01750 [Microbispora cellulosiformans]